MNREICFRLWDKHLKQMIFEGYHIIGEVTIFGMISQHVYENPGTSKSSLERYNDFVEMQFTGLRDKSPNKSLVYEGDVVNVTNKGIYNGNKVVVWDEILLCYCLVWAKLWTPEWNSQSSTTYLKVSSGINCKIVGNIFSNPELIKP